MNKKLAVAEARKPSCLGRAMTPSLCETCEAMREVRTARSRFLLCELSVTNTAYPKYPAQPVIQCNGYRPRSGEADPRLGDQPGGRP
jgi:hypothetical protein